VTVSAARKLSNMPISLSGIILAIMSAFIWSAYWILNLMDNRPPETKLFLNFAIGTVFVAFTAFIFANPITVPPGGILGSLYIGAFEMGITFLLWLNALEFAERQTPIANLIYLSPFISLLFINKLLGEKILPTTVIGLILIVTGIATQKK
jgi:drug/metabolite transporter (DMT)-like permease